MIPTIYDFCEKNVVSVNIKQTVKEAIDAIASNEKRTIVVINDLKKEIKYSILSTVELIDFKINEIDENTTLDKIDLNYNKTLPYDLSILSVLNHISSNDQYMILCKNSKLMGIISYTDIIHNIDPKLIIEKQNIGSIIMDYKAIFTYEDASTLQAVSIIKENKIDAVIIKNNKHQATGIFTTKDFLNLMDKDVNLSTPIKEYMTKPLKTLKTNSSIADALDFIKEEHFKRIVVEDEKEQVVGVITQKELLKASYNKWIELLNSETKKISKINKELLEKKDALESEISLDYLTKLSNRFTFENKIKNRISNKESNFCLVLIDIDDFKFINHTYGHLEGDATLQEIAKALTYTCKENDLLSRWGGEKFIIALNNTNIEEALIIAQTIRKTIENYIFKIRIQLTCSIGVSQFHEKDDKDTLIARAEIALKEAKRNGKNRVEIESFE